MRPTDKTERAQQTQLPPSMLRRLAAHDREVARHNLRR